MAIRTGVVALRTIAILSAIVAGATPALATSTSFSDMSAVAGDQHDVSVTFTESGLTPFQTVTERLQARAKESYACYDSEGERSGSAAVVERPADQSDYQTSASGSIESGVVTTSVLPQDVCPKGETSYLFMTVFGKIVLTDLANGISVRVPGRFTSCSPADCVSPAHL